MALLKAKQQKLQQLSAPFLKFRLRTIRLANRTKTTSKCEFIYFLPFVSNFSCRRECGRLFQTYEYMYLCGLT